VKIASITVFARRNIRTIEALVIIFAIVGAAITLAIGGSVRSDTIRVIDVSRSVSPPYGELSSSSTIGYADDFSGWIASSNTKFYSTSNSLLVSGVFQNASTWTAVNLFKNANVDLTSYPILNADVNLTAGVRYGIRFFSQYSNGTESNIWWEGSPLDHRPGLGYESLRVNMQREAFLATGHPVGSIDRIQLYVEDRPYSPQGFQLTLSKLSFENYTLGQVSNNHHLAVYFDLKSAPQENASWYLNKFNLGVIVQATPGSTFSVYFFDGPILYASTTAFEQSYNSLTSATDITFYPNLQPQVFTELLPLSATSIVFVATSGTLQSVTMQFANFEFLPTTMYPDLTQQSLRLYYVYFIFFLFLLPVGIAILVFREFLFRELVPRSSIVVVAIAGMLCRIALATTTAHVFDMNVYLTSIRSWFQYRDPMGSLGPTLPFTFFLYWVGYSPYAILQIAGFRDTQFLGHAAGVLEGVFVRLFPIIMDALTFFLLFRFRRNGPAFVWATFYFLNPLAIFISSVWGQYEAASMALVVWGIYWMSRDRVTHAALAFVASGMIELIGFFPYVLLLLRTARLKLYRTLLFATLGVLPLALYHSEVDLIFRVLLGIIGLTGSQFSGPGVYNLLGTFNQLSVIMQIKPLFLSESIVSSVALIQTFRQTMSVERLVLYIALSSIFLLLFANVLASWVWLLPICLLYALMKGKNDLGAFMMVFGTTVTFLIVSNTTGSAYLLLGNVGFHILPAIEAVQNRLQIFTIMVTSLSIILLLLLKYGSGNATQTMLRTSAMVLSIYVLLYFWLGVYSS